jgi:actin-like ATPase involved in cell morphogenesis
MQMKAIGIDLGITNAAAAVAVEEVKILRNRYDETKTPAVVAYLNGGRTSTGDILVGREAVNHAVRDPENVVFAITRLLGCVYGEPRLEKARRQYSYRIADPPPPGAEDQTVRVQLGEQAYTPVEILAMILKRVQEDAEQALGEAVTHAVISVPVYYTEQQRQATREAAELAGLTVLSLIDDPVAATMASGMNGERRKRVLVYDLGGGSFNLAIVERNEGQLHVLACDGDEWLGGDFFDQVIVRRMIDWVADHYSVDLSGDRGFLARAKAQAEWAKIELSRRESVRIKAMSIAKLSNPGDVDIDMELPRSEFEADIQAPVKQTIEQARTALDRQSLRLDDITQVVVVGGSTAVPLVQRTIEEEFGREKVQRHVNPAESVAMGAALAANRLKPEQHTAHGQTNVDGDSTSQAAGTNIRAQRSNQKRQDIDRVSFSAFAPPLVRAGSAFVLNIWAYLEEQREEMLERARHNDRVTEVGIKGPVRVRRAGQIGVHLAISGFVIEDCVDIIEWDGQIANAAFAVTVPEKITPGGHVGKATFLCDGRQIGRLHFSIHVDREQSTPQPLDVDLKRIRSVFASYATYDRTAVLQWARGAQAVGVDVFVDVLSLREGQDWETALWQEIPSRDLFCLFWSAPASESPWVEKEWRCALDACGIEFIHPVPLVDPREVAPPPELAKSKHFNDLTRIVLDYERLRRGTTT